MGMAPSGFPCSTSASAVPTLTVYSLTPEAQLRTPDHIVINTYGDDGYSDVYNGFETSFNARLPNGTNIFGGWTMERNLLTRCDTRNDPNELMFCDPTGAWGPDSYGGYDVPWLNEFKLSGTLPLPGGLTFEREPTGLSVLVDSPVNVLRHADVLQSALPFPAQQVHGGLPRRRPRVDYWDFSGVPVGGRLSGITCLPAGISSPVPPSTIPSRPSAASAASWPRRCSGVCP